MNGARPYKVQMSTDSRPITRLVASKSPLRDLMCEKAESGITFLRNRLGRELSRS